MKSRDPVATRQQILNVAERHFALYGFAGTSLRGVIKEAEVNIAAVAYHFGDKEELYRAVVHRFAAPVVDEQLKQVDLVAGSSDLSAVLNAFYLPPLKLVKSRGKAGQTLALFLGRMQTEPEPIFSIVDQQFAGCRTRFIDALGKCIPDASASALQWNFEFMLSLIVCFLTRQAQIRKRYAESSDWKPEVAAARMIDFCLAGMFAPGRFPT